MKINLNNVRFKLFKELFPIFEEALTTLDVDFYVLGALARDIIYSSENAPSRTTADVDLALYISGGEEKYKAVIDYLKDKHKFVQHEGNVFSVISPLGYTIDLLPFGDIEVEDGVSITGQGLVDTKVNGFKEVYDSGLVEIESEEGFSFSVASLEAIVMLKLIAFDDRAEQRPKDPGDVASIINHYFDLNLEDIYDNHNDLFVEHDGEEYSIQALSAQVIGRKLGSIILSSVKIRQRIKAILNTHIEQGEDATFIKRMVGPDCPDIETAVLWLTKLLIGMEEKI